MENSHQNHQEHDHTEHHKMMMQDFALRFRWLVLMRISTVAVAINAQFLRRKLQ